MVKFRTFPLVCGITLTLILVGTAVCAPKLISGISVSTEGNRETLHIFVKGVSPPTEVPCYRDYAFRHAGYGYLEFPGAVLNCRKPTLEHNGIYLQRIQLQSDESSRNPVTRVFFYLKKWIPYTIKQDKGEIKVIFSPKSPEAIADTLPEAYFSIMQTSKRKMQNAKLSNPKFATPNLQLPICNSPPDLLDKYVDAVKLSKKFPILLAQATPGEKESDVKTPSAEFYVPPSGKETAPRAAPAILPQEDIFAQLVTLRFKDADLQNVIRMIAQKTGLNVIMAREQVTGTITLNLEDVPLGAALDAILKTRGLAFVREPGEIVRIVPRSEIRATVIELKTVHIPVNWVPAPRLAETLRPFLSKAEGAQIQADADSNALIITDTPPNVDTLIALEEKLDVPEKQVMIEMRLVDIGRDALRQIGSNWSLTQKVEPKRIPIIEKETITNPITGQVEKIIERITGYTEVWDKTPDAFNSFARLYPPGGAQWSWGKAVSILGEDFDFDIFAEAYSQKGLVRVLANPKVITLNNIPAKIEMTEEIPYTDTVIGSGGAQTVKAEFKETGITMEVTPNITNNGYVRMKIKPEQKIYRGLDKVSHRYPQVDKRSAETNVIVRDEQTVVIGGLRQHIDTLTLSGTPWFMDIPVIGWLFKSSSTEKKKLEMVMFVTPHIIKEPTLTDTEKLQYEQIDYEWELPSDFFREKKGQKSSTK